MAILGDLRRFKNALDPTTRGWAVIFVGDAARMMLSFVAGVLIARTLGPIQFGVYVVLGAAVAIGGVVADLGLSQAAVVRVAGVWRLDEERGRRRGRVFVWARLVAAAAVTLSAVVLAPWLARALGLPDEVGGYSGSVLLALALVGLVVGALSGAVSTLFQATGRFASIAALVVTNGGLTLVLAGVLVIAGRLDLFTVLLIMGIIPPLVTFLVGWRMLGPGWRLKPPSGAFFQSEIKELLRFGGWLWVAGLLTALASRLDLLLVNRISEPAVVGAYGLAFGLAGSVGMVGGSLYTVLLPAASALRDPSEYREYVRRGLVRSLFISLLLVPVAVFARPFITLVYGPDYVAAVPLFLLFLPVAVLEILVMPLLLLVVPLDVPQWLAAAGGLRVAVVAVMGWLLLPVWGPPGAIAARAVAVAAAAGLVAAVLVRIAGKRRPAETIDPMSGYARWAPGYPPHAHNPLMEAEEEAVRRLLPDLNGACCLDLACGSGRYLRILADGGADCTVGVDIVPQMLAEAQKLKPHHDLVLGRFEHLPFPVGVFDLVVCGLAVGHTADLDAVVSEMARVIRPGGVLIYSDFHPDVARSGGERTFTTGDGSAYRLEHNIHDVADHRRACGRAKLTIDALIEPIIGISSGLSERKTPAVLVVRATLDPQ